MRERASSMRERASNMRGREGETPSEPPKRFTLHPSIPIQKLLPDFHLSFVICHLSFFI